MVCFMSVSPESAADTGPDPQRARDANAAFLKAAEDTEILRELAQIGMGLARLVKANAEAKLAKDPGCDLVRVDQMFARISRSIRQTLAFEPKLAEMREKQATASLKEAQAQAVDIARKRSRQAKVERAVTETIEAETGPSDRENLLTDLHERLLDPDIEADLASISIGELVAGICDDLGLKPDWAVWKRKGWYLTENWHSRLPKPEPGEEAPEEHWAFRIAEALEDIDAVMNRDGPPKKYAVTAQGRAYEIGKDTAPHPTPPPPMTGSRHDPPEDEDD
jgi:hypothetical protein